MKIFSTNNLYKNNTFKIADNKSSNYYLTKFEDIDNFEKTKKQPTFKANLKSLQKTAQKIIEDPSLREKFAAFLATGFATITAIALGKDSEEEYSEKSEAEVVADAYRKISEEEEIKTDNLKKEEIKEEVIENETIQKEEIKNDETEDLSANYEIFSIELPRKSGAKPKKIKELEKLNNAGIKVSKESNQMLQEICTYLLANKGEEINNTAQKLRISLSKAQSIEEKNTIIQNIYNEFLPQKTEEVVEADQNEEKNTIIENKTDVIQPKIEVLGSVDLEKINLTIPKKSKNVHLDVINEDSEVESFTFKAPGTVSTNIKENLENILGQFKKSVYANYEKNNNNIKKPKFMRHPILGIISIDNVKDEISKQQKKNPYKHINDKTNNNYEAILEDIVDVLNSDIGYKEMFSLHGALRFIDRFVNLDSDISIEEQSKCLIASLKKAIQTEMANGIDVQAYNDINDNIGARIIIRADKLKNPAGFELGGSSDFKFTICNGFSGRYYSRPIIHTIFSFDI